MGTVDFMTIIACEFCFIISSITFSTDNVSIFFLYSHNPLELK